MADYLFGTSFLLGVFLFILIVVIVCAFYSNEIEDRNRYPLIAIMSYFCGFLGCAEVCVLLYALLNI